MTAKAMGKGRRPLIFGEVLFDVFPDHREVMGGAPFNVAMHLVAFGEDPLFITRVGNDRRGQTLLDRMERWKLDTSGVQVDREHPTGIVGVTIEKGEPQYSITPGAAWDFLEIPREEDLPEKRQVALCYHGSLALRYMESRKTYEHLRKRINVPVFLDLNLRRPWYSTPTVQSVIGGATWLKLNRDELREVTTGVEQSVSKDVADLRKRWNVPNVIITEGQRGAVYFDKNGKEIKSRGSRVRDMQDTVGAGDAFSAVSILGLLRGWSAEKTLDRATAFAAKICTLRGALPGGRNFYEETVKEWNAVDDKKKSRK